MSSVAAGAYLKYLREIQKIKQEDVAAYLKAHIGTNTTNKQIYLWENGETMPAADAIAAFTACIGGSPEHVMQLLLEPAKNSTTDAQVGIDLAREDYNQRAITDLARTVPSEQLAEASKILARLSELMPGINDLLREKE